MLGDPPYLCYVEIVYSLSRTLYASQGISIHRHCTRRPLCLQMCMHGLQPKNGAEWTERARRFFSSELREDVPVSMSILGIAEKYVSLIWKLACRRSENWL